MSDGSPYDDALAFLLGRIDYERVPPTRYRDREYKLDRMRELLRRLGEPQSQLKIVHIAGTKGKGSTAVTLAAICTAAGLRTGAFTSPHLDRLEERIAIDARPCSSDQLVQLVDRMRPVVESLDAEAAAAQDADGSCRGPTYFELTTALALLHFAEEQVDLAVLEVGMGGRLDSTNVCRPVCSVITSISYDHTRQLGTTLGRIASEKAGIVKDGVPVISGVTEADAAEVIRLRAAEHHAPLMQLGIDFDFRYHRPGPDQTDLGTGTFDYIDAIGDGARSLQDLPLSLLGRHQAANSSVALAVVPHLERAGFCIPESAIRDGLRNVRCCARVELVGRRPDVVVDVAHNVASAAALMETVKEIFDRPLRILVFASSAGKDVPGMLRRLLPNFDQVVFTRYLNNPRALAPESILAIAEEIQPTIESSPTPSCRICPDPATAWESVKQSATADTLIVVTGSFFIASEMRHLIVGDRAALEQDGNLS